VLTSVLLEGLELGHQILGPRECNLGSLLEGSRALELVLGRVLKRAKRFTADFSVFLDNLEIVDFGVWRVLTRAFIVLKDMLTACWDWAMDLRLNFSMSAIFSAADADCETGRERGGHS
jgi:hypothetical protein